MDLSKRTEAEQLSQLDDSAKHYESRLRHRLDQYASANSALGAFFSASNTIEALEFDNYLRASHVFEQLQGISSFGYLPEVPVAQAGRFEAEASRTFPGFKIRQQRDGATAYFPLLYAQHATDPGRADQLRGFDYSAIPVRWAAMQQAGLRDEPVATTVHTALRDPGKGQVVMIFSPVRKPLPVRMSMSQKANLDGFIFSTVYIDPLFRNFDNGRLAQHFDLEVFDERRGADRHHG